MTKQYSILIYLTLGLLGIYFFLAHKAEPIPNAGELFLPQLITEINNVSEIDINTPQTHFIIKKTKYAWQLDKQILSIVKIRNFLFGLSETRIIEPKTSNKAKYTQLGVDPEHYVNKIILKNPQNNIIASFYLGKNEPIKEDSNRILFYARNTGAQQSYLIETSVPNFAQISDWIITP